MRILITGGAGFIGCNMAARFLARGAHVIIFDNLSRPGTSHNITWLHHIQRTSPGTLHVIVADIRDTRALDSIIPTVDVVAHFAGQVAVTRSIHHPRHDFETNLLGTFNVLESARCALHPPIVLFASTNKVYGGMEQLAIIEEPTRYAYRDLPHGIPETYPLDFHSPYGCSKGASDQYVRDYHRIYGLRTVVFRQSCCYGTRQFGVEDQGWVAHFVIAAHYGRPIVIYGNGKQVRDLLFIDDLITAYERAIDQIETAAGKIYNLGGGAANSLSIWLEFQPILSRLAGATITPTHYGDWRPGDQPVFISDIRAIEHDLGWRPQVGIEEGIARLWHWVGQHPDLFESIL